MKKYEALLDDYSKALERLKEVLTIPEITDIIRDSAIQRFEFTFDLAWKVMKTVLLDRHGVTCASPKGCIREAFQNGLISYDQEWLNLCDLRNTTSHAYGETMAKKVFSLLPSTLKYFDELWLSVK